MVRRWRLCVNRRRGKEKELVEEEEGGRWGLGVEEGVVVEKANEICNGSFSKRRQAFNKRSLLRHGPRGWLWRSEAAFERFGDLGVSKDAANL